MESFEEIVIETSAGRFGVVHRKFRVPNLGFQALKQKKICSKPRTECRRFAYYRKFSH